MTYRLIYRATSQSWRLSPWQSLQSYHLTKRGIEMGTRSFIGIANPKGDYSAIYCHYDGYPDYMGAMLRELEAA